jgi:hypothetical protein
LCLHWPGSEGHYEDAAQGEDVTDQFFQFRLVSIILTSTPLLSYRYVLDSSHVPGDEGGDS